MAGEAARALAQAFPLRERQSVKAQLDVERALLEQEETRIRRGGRRAPICGAAGEERATVRRRQLELPEIIGRRRLEAPSNQAPGSRSETDGEGAPRPERVPAARGGNPS